jgi:hypothetical protein
MLSALLFALVAGDPAGGAPEPVRVCNDMKIEVANVVLDDDDARVHIGDAPPLKPGACAAFSPAVAAGYYSLRFVEHGPKGEVAMCGRTLAVKPGDVIRISPDDGSICFT